MILRLYQGSALADKQSQARQAFYKITRLSSTHQASIFVFLVDRATEKITVGQTSISEMDKLEDIMCDSE